MKTLIVVVACSTAWLAGQGLALATSPKDDLGIKIHQWVKELNADSYRKRRAASINLQQVGKRAFPALIEATKDGNREVTTRAIHILKEHFESATDKALKTAAKSALEKISSGTNRIAAGQAKEAITPAAKPNPVRRPRIVRRVNIAPFGGGLPRIQLPRAGAARRTNITINRNGQKTRIQIDGKKISIQVTQKDKNGKDVVEIFEAKDLDELKKKHPNGYKIYQKNKPIIDRIQNRRFAPRARAARPGQAVPRRRVPRLDIQKRILESRKRSLESIQKNIDRLKKLNQPAFNRNIESLERTKKRFEDRYEQAKKQYEAAKKKEQVKPVPKKP